MKVLETLKKDNGKTYVTIYHDEQLDAVVDVWEGYYGTEANFNKALNRVVELIEKNRYSYWIADLRKLEGPFNASSDFIKTEVTPRASKAGLKKEAVVMPKNFFAELSAKQTAESLAGDYIIKVFGDIDNAKKWLKED